MAKITVIASLLFASLLGCPQAFAQEIQITEMHTTPSQVHPGDSFKINATITNNSPNAVSFDGGCQSPLSAAFDKNVLVSQAMGCFAIFDITLKPGQNATVVAPGSANSYTATSPGSTDANLTFVYHLANNTKDSLSKSLTFDISYGTPVPEFQSSAEAILVLAVTSVILIMMSTKTYLFKL